jgi:hypothetical protein
MVAERLRRIEKQDEASQATLKTALKDTAAAAISGAYPARKTHLCLTPRHYTGAYETVNEFQTTLPAA